MCYVKVRHANILSQISTKPHQMTVPIKERRESLVCTVECVLFISDIIYALVSLAWYHCDSVIYRYIFATEYISNSVILNVERFVELFKKLYTL